MITTVAFRPFSVTQLRIRTGFSCAGFRTPAVTKPPHARAAGVRKAPRHEIAGRWGPVGAAGLYGDLAARSGWARLDRSVRSNRLAAQDGCRWRTERAQRALPDRVGGATAGRFIDMQ